MATGTIDLPLGATLQPLTAHRDQRGWLCEIFRTDRSPDFSPCQWNATMSEANVLRGVHVHVRHRDYLVVLKGRISVGLFDLRPDSMTAGRSALLELCGDELQILTLPTGVMHGFYVHEPTLYVYGVDAYYDPADELGCHWADPDLGIDWPCLSPELSPRDRAAGTLAEVRRQFVSLAAPS
jgi:dTDP-4-dehydrorhamnose 3,5-epimerase